MAQNEETVIYVLSQKHQHFIYYIRQEVNLSVSRTRKQQLQTDYNENLVKTNKSGDPDPGCFKMIHI